ncbi:MAG: hemerythrin domain-containing protein [Nodosilinea sp.]
MPAVLTDQNRAAIAKKLADIKTIQTLIVSNERQLLGQCDNTELRKRLEDMLEDDQKNLEIVDTVIVQYGIPAEPKNTVQKMVDQTEEVVTNSELSLYEKMAQHELLKHGQVMSGIVVHKAAQVVGKDVELALAPLNTVNFENRAHQEQIKGMLEYLGTQELTGQAPDQGFWARVRDAAAAATGVFGSAVSQAPDDTEADIMSLIFMDHQKAKALINDIKNEKDTTQIKTLFGQLYTALIVHSKAEEAVVYPTVKSFYGNDNTQELYDEQAQLESLLNEMKAMGSTGDPFMAKVKQLKTMVGDHTRQEESTMFTAMRKNLSEQQQREMGQRFKDSKKQLQAQM